MKSNLEPLLRKVKTNLDKWGKMKLILYGKMYVITKNIVMVVAPQINYTSMMLPVKISSPLFKHYDNIINDCLW